MRRYAVVGNPVTHSRAPEIYHYLAQQARVAMSYERLEPNETEFEGCLQQFAQQGGAGVNVTLPFKRRAWYYVDHHSRQAAQAGAVNAIRFDHNGEAAIGHNTDGEGLVRDLIYNLKWPLTNQRLLIIGAGGAAAGILPALLQQQPAYVGVVNRTHHKAVTLAQQYQSNFPVQAVKIEQLPHLPRDMVINATSASLHGSMPLDGQALNPTANYCYDLFYHTQRTEFLRQAQAKGCEHIADGWGMLVEQAVESCHFWLGKTPDSSALLNKTMFFTS